MTGPPARGARTALGVGSAAVALLAASCSSAAPVASGDPLLSQPIPRSVTVTTAVVGRLGRILTDGSGHVLYMFPPDAGGSVRCVGACAGTWPALAVADGTTPSSGGGVNRLDLSTVHDPNTGQRIVAYFGYPLYRYAGDVDPRTANGQALFNNGGPWYALDANGDPVTSDPGGH